MKTGDQLIHDGQKAIYRCDVDAEAYVIDITDGAGTFSLVVPRSSCSPSPESLFSIFDEWAAKLKVVQRELHQAKMDLSRVGQELERKCSSLHEGIIDLSALRHAKGIIHVFVRNRLHPTVCKKLGYESKINIQLTIGTDDSIAWVTEINDGSYRASSLKIDDKYGFFFDKSDEEMVDIALKRAGEHPAEEWDASTVILTEDKYLTGPLLKLKAVYQEEEVTRTRKKLRKEAEVIKGKLAKIESKHTEKGGE